MPPPIPVLATAARAAIAADRAVSTSALLANPSALSLSARAYAAFAACASVKALALSRREARLGWSEITACPTPTEVPVGAETDATIASAGAISE